LAIGLTLYPAWVGQVRCLTFMEVPDTSLRSLICKNALRHSCAWCRSGRLRIIARPPNHPQYPAAFQKRKKSHPSGGFLVDEDCAGNWFDLVPCLGGTSSMFDIVGSPRYVASLLNLQECLASFLRVVPLRQAPDYRATSESILNIPQRFRKEKIPLVGGILGGRGLRWQLV